VAGILFAYIVTAALDGVSEVTSVCAEKGMTKLTKVG
jgi:hypothetical protein